MTVSRWGSKGFFLKRLAAGALAACVAWAAAAQAPAEPLAVQPVQVPSLDAPKGAPVRLAGWWYPAAVSGPAPAVVLLHGCGGMLDARGEPNARTREYAALLHAQGWHVLALDSLGARGERELCTQRIGTRAITMTQRRRDALGALQWLAARPEVDAARLALLGWSNGGSTVLAANNLNDAEVAAAPVRARTAVAYYPGCEAEQRRGYRAASPTLLLLGLADDWVPAAPCLALARAAQGQTVDGQPAVTALGFEGAYHGFDGHTPVRLRRDVPNGTHPGQGVHRGANPEARERAQAAMLAALRQGLAGR